MSSQQPSFLRHCFVAVKHDGAVSYPFCLSSSAAAEEVCHAAFTTEDVGGSEAMMNAAEGTFNSTSTVTSALGGSFMSSASGGSSAPSSPSHHTSQRSVRSSSLFAPAPNTTMGTMSSPSTPPTKKSNRLKSLLSRSYTDPSIHQRSTVELTTECPGLEEFIFPDEEDGGGGTGLKRRTSWKANQSCLEESKCSQGVTNFTIAAETGAEKRELVVISARVSTTMSVGVVSDYPYLQLFGGFVEFAANQLKKWSSKHQYKGLTAGGGGGSPHQNVPLAGSPGRRRSQPLDGVNPVDLPLQTLADIMQPFMELVIGDNARMAIAAQAAVGVSSGIQNAAASLPTFTAPSNTPIGTPIQFRCFNGLYESLAEKHLMPTTSLIERPDDQRFLGADVPMSHLLYSFAYSEIRLLQSLVAQEERIVFVADTYAQAANCVLTAAWGVLAPLKWGAACIPVLPSKYIDTITSDVPFLAGTAAATLPELLVLPLSGAVWIADCRDGTVYAVGGSAAKASHVELLPHSERLKAAVKKHVPKLTRQQWLQSTQEQSTYVAAAEDGGNLLPPRFTPANQLDLLTAFTDFLVSTCLGQYRQYLQPDGNIGGYRIDIARCLMATAGNSVGRRMASTSAVKEWVDDTLSLEATRAAQQHTPATTREPFYDRCAYRFPDLYPEFAPQNAPTAKKKLKSFMSGIRDNIKTAVGNQATHASTGSADGPNVYRGSGGGGSGSSGGGKSSSASSTAQFLMKSLHETTKSAVGAVTGGGDASSSSAQYYADLEVSHVDVHRLTLDVLGKFDVYHELLDPSRAEGSSASSVAGLSGSTTDANGNPGSKRPAMLTLGGGGGRPRSPSCGGASGRQSPAGPSSLNTSTTINSPPKAAGSPVLHLSRQDTQPPSVFNTSSPSHPQRGESPPPTGSYPPPSQSPRRSLDDIFSDIGVGGIPTRPNSKSPQSGSAAAFTAGVSSSPAQGSTIAAPSHHDRMESFGSFTPPPHQHQQQQAMSMFGGSRDQSPQPPPHNRDAARRAVLDLDFIPQTSPPQKPPTSATVSQPPIHEISPRATPPSQPLFVPQHQQQVASMTLTQQQPSAPPPSTISATSSGANRSVQPQWDIDSFFK